MKRIQLHFATLILMLLVFSLDSMAQHAFYFELAGNGGLYSVNYERRLNQTFSARAGMSFYNTEDKTQGLKENVFTMPLLINWYVWKRHSNYFEVSGGFVFGNEKKTYTNGDVKNVAINYATGFIGYRYQKEERGFLWRIGLTPLYNLSNGDFWPSIGLSFGYHF